jgi:hypothetical protein
MQLPLTPEGKLLIVSRRLMWRLDEEGCDSIATYQDLLSVTQGLASFENVTVRKEHCAFLTLLGLGLLRIQVGKNQGNVVVFGGIATVQNNTVEVVTSDAFVSDAARPGIERIPQFKEHSIDQWSPFITALPTNCFS